MIIKLLKEPNNPNNVASIIVGSSIARIIV
jgi:hypothetical protein